MKEELVIEWLKQHFNLPKLDEKEIKPILHFSLLWNLFEHTYFDENNRLNPSNLLKLSSISSSYISDEHTNLFNFFKDRFVSEGIINDRFESLKLSNNANKTESNYNLCFSVLTKVESSKLDKLSFIFLIIHRYRNNLFHGRKDPKKLNLYKKPFEHINSFLMNFVDATSENKEISKFRYKK